MLNMQFYGYSCGWFDLWRNLKWLMAAVTDRFNIEWTFVRRDVNFLYLTLYPNKVLINLLEADSFCGTVWRITDLSNTRQLTMNVSHSIFCNLLKRLLLLINKKYSRDFGDISEILSELNLRTMRRNNGRTKNDRYQKAALKGTKISRENTYTDTNGDKKPSVYSCECVYAKGFETSL